MIEASGLAKSFGSVRAVQDLTFSVPNATVLGLLGPNGAGKTTTIRMLAGLLVPDQGTLQIDGRDVAKDGDGARHARMVTGYLPESAPLHPELRTLEFLRYRAALLGLSGRIARDAIDQAVAACGLGPVAGRLLGALSKGFRQRVGVAAAILGDRALGTPKVVILDEPSVGLDPRQLIEFRGLVRSLGRERTVLLSSHLLAEVDAVCDAAILMHGGRLVASGSIQELRRRGGTTYTIEWTAADPSHAAATIARTAAPLAATTVDLGAGWRRTVVVRPPGDRDDAAASSAIDDLREPFARSLRDSGATVRELRRDDASLEGLFLDVLARRGGGPR
jgi:ABC-2 type transport system ATP-binding protein